MSALGLVLLATVRPSIAVGIAVSGLLAAGYVMDSVDGQLARLRGMSSLSGEWLDHTVDCIKTSSLHLAVLISLFRFPSGHDRLWLLVPVAFAIVDAVSFFGLVTLPLLRKLHGSAIGRLPAAAVGREHPLRMWLLLPTDYGVLCWIFVLLAWPTGFLTAYTALLAVNAAVLVLALRKWWHELRRLDGFGV